MPDGFKTNGREFREQLEASKAALAQEALLWHKKICFLLLTGVIYKTPVDTGRARGNWQSSIGQPLASQSPILDKTGNIAFAAGAAVLAQLRPFQTFWLSNNLPYIERLEDGWSKRQAPNGFVGLTLAHIRTIL